MPALSKERQVPVRRYRYLAFRPRRSQALRLD